MKLRQSLFALPNPGPESGRVQAQTKPDVPGPYPDGNFHTRNVKKFAEVLLNK
jgi:hypothetical protein